MTHKSVAAMAEVPLEEFDKLPGFVDYDTREAAEAQLAELACGLKPEGLRHAADRLAAMLDQDGELSDDDRARQRYLIVGKQDRDGMSDIRGRIDPETRGLWDAVAAKWAAPGMCNPDDENPCVDGEPAPESMTGDARSTGQRNHDPLKAMARATLASGQLGSHKGLPSPWSSPPHSKSSNPALAMQSPAAPCCRCPK
jgi:hypothetical protein